MVFSPEMRIHLHGYLKTLYPNQINVNASSVAEAVSALQLIPELCTGKRHSVSIDGFGSRDALYDQCDLPEIHLRPVMAGAGKPGTLQTIIGIVLVVSALVFGGPLTAAGMLTATGSLVLTGSMMVLGGILQLLAPQPTLTGTKDERSRYLGTPKNTVAIGTRIPLIYGRRKAYGHYISFDIDAGNLNSAPADWYASTFTQFDATVPGTAPGSGAPTPVAGSAPVDAALPPPTVVDTQPQATWVSTTRPESITATPQVFLNFSPELDLLAGYYRISFISGTTVSAHHPSGGITSSINIVGGVLPPDELYFSTITFEKTLGKIDDEV